MKWNNIRITIFKELRGIVRDKKSLHKLILYPLLIPLIIVLFGVLFDTMEESKYTVGVNYSLNESEEAIIDEIEYIKMEEYSTKKDLEEAYQNQNIDGYVIKEDNHYTIYADDSGNRGQVVISYVSDYLDSYNRVLGEMYLAENQIDSNKVYNSILVDTESLAEHETNPFLSTMAGLIVTYVLMIVILVCVVVVTDAISGEKERGTLETILTFPVRSSELVVGKYLSSAILGFVVGTISYLLSIPTFYFGKKFYEVYEEVTFSSNVGSIFLIIFVILLASLLSSGVCMALSGRAKTYKEAQSSLQFVSFLVMIPYFATIMEVDNSIFSFIPLANCGLALTDIVANKVDVSNLLIIIGTTILYTVIILMYVSKQYKSEKTLFS